MISMLDKIVAKTEERLIEAKSNKSLDQLKEEVSKLDISDEFPFKEALRDPEIAIIAEVKIASPSKGLIAEDFDYIKIAKEYEQAGASAISVLTEPYFFKGSNDYLKKIAENVHIPILRKDFTIDEYMIYEAKTLGASAILLIVSILDDVQLKAYLDLAHDLGLSAIVETHDADEIKTASTLFSFNLLTSSAVLMPLSEMNNTSSLTNLRKLTLLLISTVKSARFLLFTPIISAPAPIAVLISSSS